MRFVELGRQHHEIEANVNKAIQAVLQHGQFILGPEVTTLEDRLCDFIGVKYAVTVANGTDAITISLMALGIGHGAAVFVPAFTFFATAEAVSIAGATPIFVDVDESTFNIDVRSLEKAIENVSALGFLTPKAVIAVDLFGRPADYAALIPVINKFRLHLIEDAAQSFGAKSDGQLACNFGDIAATSFFPSKPLGCYGDGGAIFTNDANLARECRSIRVHGSGENKYRNLRIGMNSRLDTIQAAVLLVKLAILPDELSARDRLARYYSKCLGEEFHVPVLPKNLQSAWAQYTVRPKNRPREECLTQLQRVAIPYGIFYETPLHLQPAFSHLGYSSGDLPNSENLSRQVFSLPMHPYIKHDERERIVAALLD